MFLNNSCFFLRLRNPMRFLLPTFLLGGSMAELTGQEVLTAAGKPTEGELKPFLGEPVFDRQVIFGEDGSR